jgi:hypothetical protein
LLLYVVHHESVYAATKALLEPEHWSTPVYRKFWAAFSGYREREGHAPDYEVISAELRDELTTELIQQPQPVMRLHTEAQLECMDDLTNWLYLRPTGAGNIASRPEHERDGFRQLERIATLRCYDQPMARLLSTPGHSRRDKLKAEYDAKLAQIKELCQGQGQDTDVSLEALTSGTYTHNWLIKNVLVEGSPMIVGGPKKALKTSILLDLAVSLGIGEGAMFLNHHRFRVEKHVAVGMYSGESNAPTVATTVRNILASKNRKPGEAAVYLQFATPKLSADGDIAAVTAFIKKRGLKVIIFDPAYTSLLKGNSKASASNVFDMGEVLSKITEACLAAGATPVFAHHTVKHAGKKPGRNGTMYQSYEPAELGDLAFAGFAEFARQWLLIARRADYEPGTGKHQLWLTTGGSAGFNGCYALDIDEGMMLEDFSGKKWEVSVKTQAEAARSQVTAKVDAAARKELDDRQKVLNALTEHGRSEGMTVNKLLPHVKLRRETVERHLIALSDANAAEICGEFKGGELWKASCWNKP